MIAIVSVVSLAGSQHLQLVQCGAPGHSAADPDVSRRGRRARACCSHPRLFVTLVPGVLGQGGGQTDNGGLQQISRVDDWCWLKRSTDEGHEQEKYLLTLLKREILFARNI